MSDLLRIRLTFDNIADKLNALLSSVMCDPTMARANYESKIKFFFYEKCLANTHLMYESKEEVKQKPRGGGGLRISKEEFSARFSEFMNISLFEETLFALCVEKKLLDKTKKSKKEVKKPIGKRRNRGGGGAGESLSWMMPSSTRRFSSDLNEEKPKPSRGTAEGREEVKKANNAAGKQQIYEKKAFYILRDDIEMDKY